MHTAMQENERWLATCWSQNLAHAKEDPFRAATKCARRFELGILLNRISPMPIRAHERSKAYRVAGTGILSFGSVKGKNLQRRTCPTSSVTFTAMPSTNPTHPILASSKRLSRA